MDRKNMSWDSRCGGFSPQHLGSDGTTPAASTAVDSRGAPHYSAAAAAAAGTMPVATTGWGGDDGTALDDAIGRFGGMTLGGPVAGSSLVEQRHHPHAAGDAGLQQRHGLQRVVGGVDGLDMGSLRVADEVSRGRPGARHHKKQTCVGICVLIDAQHHCRFRTQAARPLP